MAGKIRDLTGNRYGRLTVEAFSRSERGEKGTRIVWLCRCDCGCAVERLSSKLLTGRTKSCGSCEKPGGNRTDWPGYSSIRGALARCFNPNDAAFAYYGGRGITVCNRWRFGEGEKSGFECFFEDMGPRPDGLTLDRVDVNGNYEPGNCRWATKPQQQQNQRRAIYSNVGGVSVPLNAYVRRLGLCYETVRRKVRVKGLTVREAVVDTLRVVGRGY